MKKRIMCLVLAFTLVCTCGFGVYPIKANAGDYSYEYKWEYSKWSKAKSTGWKYAGGQDEDGTKFTTGSGSFGWYNSGGPSASVSVSIGSKAVPVSVSIGVEVNPDSKNCSEQLDVSGYDKESREFIKTHRFKLVVKKYVKVRTVKMYKRLKYSDDEWKLAMTSYQHKVSGHDLGAKVKKNGKWVLYEG